MTTEQTIVAPKNRKLKQYTNELEKNLMVDNLRVAVDIYGKDRLREGFNSRKSQKTFRFHSSPVSPH
jgi:hypothetical protein